MEEASRKDAVKKILSSRPLIFDGAMGTEIQRRNPTKQDFGGLDGLNEILVETRPDIIREIHLSYLEAGCDVIETNSFGANAVVLAEYGIPERVYEINLKAARLAREAAETFSEQGEMKFVSGSVGPGTKLPSLGQIDFDSLEKTYIEQILGLIDGGADFIQIETSQDMLQIKAALSAAKRAMEIRGRDLFVICQATFEKSGKMLLGTDTLSFITAVSALDYVDFIGTNCATGPADMYQVVEGLCRFSRKMVSVLPNAGLPETVGGKIAYRLSPDEFARHMKRFATDYGISIAGGCCGTTPEHIRKLAMELKSAEIKERVIEEIPACSSIFVSVPFEQTPRPLIVGERTNANGSREFREKLLNGDFDGMVEMGISQGKEGAHILDLCVAYAGRDEASDMREIASRFARKIELPLMFDSTEPEVIEAALKRYGGRAVINSVNFEDGGKRFERVMSLAVRFGAAVVGLTIDEEGMAATCEKKVKIARRIVNESRKYGLKESDLFIDPLTFTLGSGDDSLRNAGIETLNAIREIKKEFPSIFTLLGVSNISFGLSAESRQVLNSVFLHHAIEAGLDAAILNAKKILPLFKIPEEEQALARRLIFNEWESGRDPLKAYIEYFGRGKSRNRGRGENRQSDSTPPVHLADDSELLKNYVIEGKRDGLEGLLERMLKKTPPLEIVTNILLEAMKVVGELFGKGEMQLPFVLESAEVMKKSVDYLNRFMEKSGAQNKGTIVLATVRGDVHDIGKNLVDIILTNNGFRVINLGIKQPIENVLAAFEREGADAIGLSGLLVKSSLVMKEDLEEMERRGLKVPVICGGAALTRRFVEDDLRKVYSGAVHYGRDAFSGLEIMNRIVSGREKVPEAINAPLNSAKAGTTERSPALQAKKTTPVETPPLAPFKGVKFLRKIAIYEVAKYLNEVALFKGQWQFKQGKMSREKYEELLEKKVRPLYKEMLEKYGDILKPQAVYGYFECNSEGNDAVIYDENGNEVGRFSFPRQRGKRELCIADYFLPRSSGRRDIIALQAVTMGHYLSEVERELFSKDRYTDYLYLHGLGVELTEALAEYVHAVIRRDLLIDSDDSPEISGILKKQYHGCRYSFGYPACPDLAQQDLILKLLRCDEIGISLTEEFQLVPEQSTTAIVVHHPDAVYFDL